MEKSKYAGIDYKRSSSERGNMHVTSLEYKIADGLKEYWRDDQGRKQLELERKRERESHPIQWMGDIKRRQNRIRSNMLKEKSSSG